LIRIGWFISGCVLWLAATVASAQDAEKYTIKVAKAAVPKELSEPIQKLLVESSVELSDSAGTPICEIWFRKELPADAAPEQLKTGVTYRELKQTEILCAVQFHRDWTDYRKQKVKAGVYTMRLCYQPTDGTKHTPEVSEFKEFAVLINATADPVPSLMEPKMLQDRSRKSVDLPHPAVFMLWPNYKSGKEPDLVSRPKNHWVMNTKVNLTIDGKATDATIGIGLTLIGHTPAE
jgi:hypothetical protein